MSYPILEIRPKTHPQWNSFFSARRAPEALWVQGDPLAHDLLEKLPEHGLAVVGTREPQLRVLRQLDDWIGELRGSGLVILSGLARGVDAQAHESALRAGLRTLAVVAGGIDAQHPRETMRIRRKILENGGLIVAESPPGTAPLPAMFAHRNRLIAAGARACWVVQAPRGSGALITAREAEHLERTVFICPAWPGDRSFAGNQALLDPCDPKPHRVCFWSPASLGLVWPRLSTLLPQRQSHAIQARNPVPRANSRAHALATRVLKQRRKGLEPTPETLYDELSREGWSTSEIYSACEEISRYGLLE